MISCMDWLPTNSCSICSMLFPPHCLYTRQQGDS
jgi:hypothetical protein